jgi:aspartate/methionine/tyrosine aminotransferase
LRYSDRLVDRSLGIIKKNLEMLDSFMERYSDLFEWVRPVAASIGFVKLKNGESASGFCKKVVDETGVLLMPSTVYEFGDSHFRIGFGREDMEECLEIFESYLEDRY